VANFCVVTIAPFRRHVGESFAGALFRRTTMLSQKKAGPPRQSGKAQPSNFLAGPRRFRPFDDPLGAVEIVSKFFQQIEEQGRESLSEFLQRVYVISTAFRERPEEFEEFAANEYFEKFRKKPKPDEVERFVLLRTMNAAESQNLRNRVTKYFPVLADFRKDNVADEEVAKFLTAGGGVDEIYEKMPHKPKKSKSGSDDSHPVDEEGKEKPAAPGEGSDKADSTNDQGEAHPTAKDASEILRADKRFQIILDAEELGTQPFMERIAEMVPGTIVNFRCAVGEAGGQGYIPLKLEAMDTEA
jgi:hypothetical protein